MNNFKFSQNSIKRMSQVHEDLQIIFNKALSVSPIDFGIPNLGGLRTEEEQYQLFLDGLTECDGIKSISNHQKGMALDFYAFVDGRASWDKNHLSLVAGVILSTGNQLFKQGKVTHQLRWGGTFGSKVFNGWDMPHIELI